MKKHLLLSIIAYILISASAKVYAQAPNLTYASPSTFTVGSAVTLTPANSGNPATSASVTPTLPAGLSIGPDGTISGTPTAVTAAADYTVTSGNTDGTNTAIVNITINPQLPAITYPTPNTFVVGTAITALNPTNTGGAIANYAISPALPGGLNFDTSTGIISGTPTTVTAAADYTVTATNVTGNSTFPVNITVNPALPNITYTTPNTFVVGTAIIALNPTNTGGAIASYAISPALPGGLNFDTSTGIISGSPTTVTAAADYTVTATNVTGNSTFPVNITVNPAVPNITYTTPNTFVVGTAIIALNPTNTGGAIASYAISPALPGGLNFDTSTGVISGTPTTVTAAADYAVTATNVTGNSTFPVNITVNPALPNITYTTPNTFVVGTAITALNPTNTGGAIASYAISPALPGGLNFDTSTGIISGTPTTVTAAADYTVTATNVTGNSSFPVNITVNPALPNITYNSPNTFTYGTAITPLSPTNTGGAIVSYSVSPALPAGLVLNTSTGVISGTPTAAIVAADYTVTATNVTGNSMFPVNITVNKVLLTVTAIDQGRIYGAANPAFTANYTGFVNGDTQASINTLATVSTTATAASPIGNYPISAIGASDNNYTFTYVDGTLAISQAALTITADNQTKTYGSAFSFAGTEFTTAGLVNSDAVSNVTFASSGSATTATVAGSPYAIVPSGATGTGLANYTISYINGTMTVNKAALTVTANNQTKTYGSTFTFAGTEFTTTGLVNSDAVTSATLTSAGSAATATVAGSPYSIVPGAAVGTGLANYTISYNNGTMTVSKAALTVTANNKTKTYGTLLTGGTGSNAFTSVGLQNGESIGTVTIAYGLGSAANASVAGSPYNGSVTASAATGGTFNTNNYTITYTPGNIIINQAALTVTANNKTKTYGTLLTGGAGSNAFTSVGLQNGESIGTVTIAYGTGAAANASIAGSPYVGSVTASAATSGTFNPNNYAITYTPGNIIITQATLTITANNVPKTYGTLLTGGTGSNAFTSVGLQNGESINTVTIAYGFGSAANASVAGSPYNGSVTASAATGGTFTPGNYAITYVSGNITVNKATLTVTANNKTKTYGTLLTGGAGSNAFTSVGLQNGESINTVTIAYGLGSAANASVAGSPYNGSVTASAATGGTFNTNNYTITYTPGNIIINQAALTVTANNKTKTYGTLLTGAAGSNAFTSVGLQNGESIGTVTIAYGTGAAANASIAGSPYVGSVTASAATSGTFNPNNYAITYTPGNIIITQATLTITANNVPKTYGTLLTGGTGSNAFTSVGLQNGESIGTVTIAYGFGSAANASVAGSPYNGSVTASAATGGTFTPGNYAITYVSGNITVNKATLTVTANNKTKTYGTLLTGGAGSNAFTSVGLQNGESIGTVTIAYGLGSAANASVAGSPYNGSVTASAATGGTFNTNNYTITYTPGNIIINQAALNITANNKTKAYGTLLTGGAGSNAFTSVGLQNGESINTVTIAYGTGAAANASVAGSPYIGSVVASAATGGTFTANDYSITYTPGNIIITPVALTITANNQSKIQGTPNPPLTVTYTGFVNGETFANLTTQPTVATTATTGSAVGTYPITVNGAVDNNYTITNVNGTLTVNPQAPVITYPTPDVFVVGTFATINPTSTGGAVANYTVAPGLPAGLTINAATGVISGTPTTVTAAANYTVTATNVTASTTFVVNITVNPALPHIAYTTPDTYGVGTTISLSPTSTGGPVASYSAPSLPAGLTINAATGVISGTPTTITGTTGYVVTATNVTGSFPFTVTITVNAAGANAYDWTGAVSTAWANPLNWQVNGIQQTTNYPGSSSTGDAARIGVNTAIATFINQPLLSAGNITIASMTFGNNNAAVNNNAGGVINLTVNGFTLAVTGAITQNHSATGGNSGFGGNDIGVTTTLLGTGTITCASMTIGDNVTLPANNPELTTTVFNIGNATASTLNVSVTGDLTINSASNPGNTLIFQNSNAYVSLGAGTLTVGGTIREVTGTPNDFYFFPQFAPSAQFSIDLNNTNAPVLNLVGATPINIGTNANNNANNAVDFYNPVTFPHKASTVNYTGANQEVYTFNNNTTTNSLIDNNGEANGDGYVYQNIGFSGSGTKTLDAGAFKVNGNFILAAGTETVSLSANNPTLTVAGNFSTGVGSTFTNGTGTITIGGGFNNDGTTNFGTPLVTFNSTAAAAFTGTAPVTFTNVAFSGGGAKNMTSGTFKVATTGILTMSANTTLNAGGFLTLASDANSSATVAAIPAGCKIQGNVNVQRYLSAHRGYRLISSPVWTATVAPNNVYSLNYVGNSAFLTGTTGTGGGFDQGVNPTLYLYRENLVPAFTTFLNSNFRGINNILSAPNYTLDTDGGPFNIPVANGFLFFFRGNKADGLLSQETVPTWPATTATLSTTGQLNQGSVTVHDWYTPASGFLGNTTISGTVTIEGTNLVGNPYASSIDWDQWGTGITETNISKFSYKLVTMGLQGSGNYDVYQAGTASKKGTQNTANANIIVSGEAFFVQAIGANPVLTFTEAAKTNTQVSGGSLYMSKFPITAAVPQYLRLQIALDTINTDGTIINFDDNSKATFDPNEDARYRAGTGRVSLSSFSSDHAVLAINRLPLIHRGQSIALKVGANIDGTFKINMTDVEGIPQLLNIWLKDKYLKDSVNMRVNNTYSFSVLHSDTNTFGSNRFELVTDQNPSFAYHLLDFNAEKVKTVRQVQVLWSTLYEENYTYFTVERSTDNGKTFNVIGSVAANNQGTYSLLDPKPIVGQNLYRLKQVDYNNVTSYSKVVPISYSDRSNGIAANNISVFPNPASSNINLAVLSDINTPITYQILVTNSVGFVIRKATTNQPNWQSNVSDLLPGTYLVKVFNDKDKSFVGSTKFVKL